MQRIASPDCLDGMIKLTLSDDEYKMYALALKAFTLFEVHHLPSTLIFSNTPSDLTPPVPFPLKPDELVPPDCSQKVVPGSFINFP